MSETSKVALGKEVSSLDISPQFDAYSGVEIIVTDEITYFAGNRTGRVLSIQNPWGTQAQATAILNALKAKGFQYQPYTAEGAILNPAAEIGDGITISDTYSGLYKIDRKYSPLMSADVQAPQDEELDHEYPYEPKQDRIYKREIAEANAQISLNANAITAEVQNRTTADNNLNTTLTSKINQTASSISATVTQVNNNKLDHTRTNTSFGWDLTSTAFKINASGNKNVFTCDSSGITIQGNATVTGKITATSGYIGGSTGFRINSTSISHGTLNASADDLATDANGNFVNGIYLSNWKFRMGNNFYVTHSGYVEAKNLNLKGGSITINDSNGNVAFRVTSTGAVTATNLALNGGSINLKNSSGTSVFRVTSSGAVSAVNMTLTGTLTVGGKQITADSLRTGAELANNGASSWDSAYTSTSSGGYCYSGAGYGYSYNKATTDGSGEYPSYFKCTGNIIGSAIIGAGVYAGSGAPYYSLTGHSHSVTVSGGTVTIGTATLDGVQGSFNIADTQYYKDGVEAAYDDGYDDGYSAGGSGVTVDSHELTWKTSSAVGLKVTLTNGREVYFSESL